MRRTIIAILVFSLGFNTWAADDRIEKANNLYTEGQYMEAIAIYDAVLSSGVESAELYFNLANAHYKNGFLADAILNYERALLLKPHDPDIKYNLELAYSQTIDKIEPVGEFFLTKWIASMRNQATSDFWAYLGVCAFLLMLVFLAFFIFSNSLVLKKGGFYLAIFFLITTTTGLVFSYQQKQKLINREFAIVVSPSIAVKSSPDSSGTEIFILHEGAKVKIVSELGTWWQIQLADGNVGWIEEKAVTMI